MRTLEKPGVTFILQWASMAMLYLALAGQASLDEGLVAMAAGLLTVLFLRAIRRHGRPYAPLLAPLPHLVPRWLISITGDVLRVTWLLLRLVLPSAPAGGRFVAQPFDPGRPEAPARSRRGLVITSLSLSPNSFIVALSHEHQQLVRHDLIASDHEEDLQWPT